MQNIPEEDRNRIYGLYDGIPVSLEDLLDFTDDTSCLYLENGLY